jgi:serine/threonine protein kinase
MLDSDFNIKVGDFGYAAPLSGPDGSGYMKILCGTVSYMAPEIIQNKWYNGI